MDLRRADDSNSYVARVSSRHQPHILFYTDRVWCSVKGAAGQATNAFLELTCLVACQHLDLSKQGLYCSYYGQDTITSPPIVTQRQAAVLECATSRPGHTTPGGSRQLSEEVPHGEVQNVIIILPHPGIRFKSEDASGTQFVRYNGYSSSSSSTASASASAVEGRSEMFVRKVETSYEVRLLVVEVVEGDGKTPQPSSANSKCEVEIGSQFFPVAATEAEAEHHSATDSSKFSSGTVVAVFVGGTVFGLLTAALVALALHRFVNKRKSDSDRSQTQGDQSTPLNVLGKGD